MEYPNSHEIEQEELSRHVARKNPAGTKEDSLGKSGTAGSMSWGVGGKKAISLSLSLFCWFISIVMTSSLISFPLFSFLSFPSVCLFVCKCVPECVSVIYPNSISNCTKRTERKVLIKTLNVTLMRETASSACIMRVYLVGCPSQTICVEPR